jgi:xanthine/uracil/vitamin C permease (AzgA family)
VNASIIADTGGTCVCTRDDLCVNDSDYLSCQDQVRQDLITTTAAVSALSSFLMGLLANLPVGLAPGLGLNAYVRIFRRIGLSRFNPAHAHTSALSFLILLSDSMGPVSFHTVRHLQLFFWKGTPFELLLESG